LKKKANKKSTIKDEIEKKKKPMNKKRSRHADLDWVVERIQT
jgi:hypothetical protein